MYLFFKVIFILIYIHLKKYFISLDYITKI